MWENSSSEKVSLSIAMPVLQPLCHLSEKLIILAALHSHTRSLAHSEGEKSRIFTS